MSILILLILFNVVVLFIGIKTKTFLYTITPETQWKKELDRFDSNLEILKKTDASNTYKLGNHHIY